MNVSAANQGKFLKSNSGTYESWKQKDAPTPVIAGFSLRWPSNHANSQPSVASTPRQVLRDSEEGI